VPPREKRAATLDFGFDAAESPYHFVVSPEATTVLFVERFAWPPDADPDARRPTLKAVLDRYRWEQVAAAVAEVFNRRLRLAGYRAAQWRENETLLAPYFGKELVLLAWAIEGADPTLIPNMRANWVGLAPEERWWLYTTINATFAGAEAGRDRGWRKAIKIAFAENPLSAPPSTFLSGDQAIREARDNYRILPPAPHPTPARRRGGRQGEPEAEQFTLPEGETEDRAP
jgi:hypothetical protein